MEDDCERGGAEKSLLEGRSRKIDSLNASSSGSSSGGGGLEGGMGMKSSSSSSLAFGCTRVAGARLLAVFLRRDVGVLDGSETLRLDEVCRLLREPGMQPPPKNINR